MECAASDELIDIAEKDLGSAIRAYLTYLQTCGAPPTDARGQLEWMREESAAEANVLRAINRIGDLLPSPEAADGAIANRISISNRDSLEIEGEMWFLGNRASWTEPMAFVAELEPSTDVVRRYKLAVGNAETGFQPVRSGRDRRRNWGPPKEWLFVIDGPRHRVGSK